MNNNHKKKVHIVENSGLGEKLLSGILKERTWIRELNFSILYKYNDSHMAG
jgi:hypothetical protein